MYRMITSLNLCIQRTCLLTVGMRPLKYLVPMPVRTVAAAAPLEHDVQSVELPHALQECYVEGTPSNIVSIVSKSLLKIPHVQGLGVLAEKVIGKMMSWRNEEYFGYCGP